MKHLNLSKSDPTLFRHGARLDKTDVGWSLNSPTPYDSPLTHHGWNQSEALGMRIGSVLHHFEHQTSRIDSPIQEATSFHDHTSGRSYRARDKKKLNVVMHSSPYLRCTQTAIAVSAGIARARAKLTHIDSGQDDHASTLLVQQPDTVHKNASQEHVSSRHGSCKIKLRLDAFLGEWLTPDYFQPMYSAPNATHLVATAKTDLLQGPGENEDNRHESLSSLPIWGNVRSKLVEKDEARDGRQSVTAKGFSKQSVQEQRTESHRIMRDAYSRRDMKLATVFNEDFDLCRAKDVTLHSTDKLFQAEPVPRRVIEQAKNAYIEIDSQWDSTIDPLSWGNGGELGEEWSEMHARFTTGIHSMLKWYANGETQNSNIQATNPAFGEVYKLETVLIIVTHGAGCNALIGALTNQPILVDVDTSSLTMFVRKYGAGSNASDCFLRSMTELPTCGYGFLEFYDLKSLAETEHLQPGVDPIQIPHNSSNHSTSLHGSEDVRQPGLGRVHNQGFNSAIEHESGIDFDRSFHSSEHVYRASGHVPLNYSLNLSSPGHVTNFRFWSDLIFARKGVNFEEISDSSSEDNFMLNFANA